LPVANFQNPDRLANEIGYVHIPFRHWIMLVPIEPAEPSDKIRQSLSKINRQLDQIKTPLSLGERELLMGACQFF